MTVYEPELQRPQQGMLPMSYTHPLWATHISLYFVSQILTKESQVDQFAYIPLFRVCSVHWFTDLLTKLQILLFAKLSELLSKYLVCKECTLCSYYRTDCTLVCCALLLDLSWGESISPDITLLCVAVHVNSFVLSFLYFCTLFLHFGG